MGNLYGKFLSFRADLMQNAIPPRSYCHISRDFFPVSFVFTVLSFLKPVQQFFITIYIEGVFSYTECFCSGFATFVF